MGPALAVLMGQGCRHGATPHVLPHTVMGSVGLWLWSQPWLYLWGWEPAVGPPHMVMGSVGLWLWVTGALVMG